MKPEQLAEIQRITSPFTALKVLRKNLGEITKNEQGAQEIRHHLNVMIDRIIANRNITRK